MVFEQNNNLKNESLEQNETKSLSSSQEVSNNDSIISEQELIDLKNKDEERVSFELAKIRESIGGNLDNDKESRYICHNSANENQPFCNSHSFAKKENFCLDGYKLKMLDYGSRHVHNFLKLK